MTPPANPVAVTARPQAKVVAYMAPTAGERPTAAHELKRWRVVEIEQKSGSGLHRAILEHDLGAQDPHFRYENRHLQADQNRQVEIWLLDPDTGERLTPLFWGEVTEIEPTISDRDSERVIVELRPEHFGEILLGIQVWDHLAEDVAVVHEDPRFNPLIDGLVVENRANPQFDADELPEDYWLWIDPEATRTEEALAAHGDMQAAPWTLDLAFETLAYWLNAEEEYVDNLPRITQNSNVRDLFAEAPELRDVTLPRGKYLPPLLDALLTPHGYSWCVGVKSKPDDEDPDITHARPWIYAYRRGTAKIQRDIKLQAAGKPHDPAKDQLGTAALKFSIVELANRIVGHGSLEEREITMELVRGWEETDDDTPLDDLADSTSDKAHVWRLWVGNEGGDYTDLRAEIEDAADLSELFTLCLPKRRPLGHCLTYMLDRDGQQVRRPPVLEYTLEGSGATEDDWHIVEGGTWGYRLLPDQIGLYFTGETPPQELYAAGADARLRITGTILGDTRLSYTAARQATSVNSNELTLVLQLGDRFHDRARATEGDYASKLTGPADERDDADDLEAFVDKIRDTEDAAGVTASIELPGLHFEYELGNLLKGIDGRKISFNRLSKASGEERYLQIVGRKFTLQPEMTTLFIEPYDAQVPLP